METTVYEVKYKDGSTFRIFCANRTQKQKLLLKLMQQEEKIEGWGVITNGLHTFKQWAEIVKNL